MHMIIAVASGGALGALLRYCVFHWSALLLGPVASVFLWGTLIVNVIGSFFMGLSMGSFEHLVSVSDTLRAFITVGVLGAFTTFSAFSWDFMSLVEKGAWLPAFFYALSSFILSIAAIFFGYTCIKFVLS